MKKTWIVVTGVLAVAVLSGAAVAGANHLTGVQKGKMLAEKQAEYEQLKAEYQELAKNNDERAYEVGNQAKDLAIVIGQLEDELGIIPDDRLQMRITSTKAALQDGISVAKRGGFSDQYINTIEQYFQEVEALEQEFFQHARSNKEIDAALDQLSDKWNPTIDEMYRRETHTN